MSNPRPAATGRGRQTADPKAAVVRQASEGLLMARTPSPWYRAERDEWRVIVRGRDHLLGNHPDGSPPPRRQRRKWTVPPPILDAFHKLMASPGSPPPGPATPD